jgi:hypothetical protein
VNQIVIEIADLFTVKGKELEKGGKAPSNILLIPGINYTQCVLLLKHQAGTAARK